MKSLRRKHIRWLVALAVIVLAAVALSRIGLGRESKQHTSSSSSLLALTWGPSLCAVEASARGCRTGGVARTGQVLLLHGLWPQPSTEQYCPINGLRPLELSRDLRDRLQTMMSDAASMAAHEWKAHGSCSGVTPQEYFGISATLTDQVRTVLDPVFQRARGQRLAVRTVRELFDARFGAGSGGRVAMSCRKAGGTGDIVYEVRLSLPAVRDLNAAGPALSLGEQLAKATPVPAGCGQARVP